MFVFVLTREPQEIRFCNADNTQDGLDNLNCGRNEKYGTITNELFEKAMKENLKVCIYLTNVS